MAVKAQRVVGGDQPVRKDQAELWVYYDGEFRHYKDAKIGLMTHALHYGTGCFEGIRAYWNPEEEQLLVFRQPEHFQRLERSARILRIRLPLSVDDLCAASTEVVRRNGFRQDTYIRPIAFKSSEEIGVRLHDLRDSFGIYATPFGDYIAAKQGYDVNHGIKCMVSSWRRIDDNVAPARAKVTGIYVNSALAKTEAMENGFDEAIVLTQEGHVSEGSAENIFLVRDRTFITPAVTENILEGITRATLAQLVREEMGLSVVERPVDRTELYIADEVFLCGTGVQLSPVTSIDRRPVGDGGIGPLTARLQRLYFDVVRGRLPKYRDWVTPVYKKAG
jgi:branched-chain amino acid aminotransferase